MLRVPTSTNNAFSPTKTEFHPPSFPIYRCPDPKKIVEAEIILFTQRYPHLNPRSYMIRVMRQIETKRKLHFSNPESRKKIIVFALTIANRTLENLRTEKKIELAFLKLRPIYLALPPRTVDRDTWYFEKLQEQFPDHEAAIMRRVICHMSSSSPEVYALSQKIIFEEHTHLVTPKRVEHTLLYLEKRGTLSHFTGESIPFHRSGSPFKSQPMPADPKIFGLNMTPALMTKTYPGFRAKSPHFHAQSPHRATP